MAKSRLSDIQLPPVEIPTEEAFRTRKTATTIRRGNPAYRQFSAYIPDQLYRRFKAKLATEDRDQSDVLEELISSWVDV